MPRNHGYPRLLIGAKRLRLQCPPAPSARGRPPFSCCRISSNEFFRATAYPHDLPCLATVRPWHAGRRLGRCRHVSLGVDTAAVRLGLIISARELAASRYRRIATMGDCVTFVIFPTARGLRRNFQLPPVHRGRHRSLAQWRRVWAALLSPSMLLPKQMRANWTARSLHFEGLGSVIINWSGSALNVRYAPNCDA